MKHFDQPPIFVSVEVPYEVLDDSGIDLDGALQFYADGKKIVIEQLEGEETDVFCEGDCEDFGAASSGDGICDGGGGKF